MDGWMGRCYVNKGGRRDAVRGRAERASLQCEPSIENTGLCGFGCWIVGCLVGYQCKASIDSIWGKRLVAWFVCCWWATHPFFLTLLPSVGASVGSACLACWLLGFGEDT